MRQRVMIAMALSCEPKLLIADEPTTALDVTIQAQILELLKEIQERTNSALMLITHDLGVVAEMVDQVVVMYTGQVVEQGTVEDVLIRPTSPYTVGLIESIPSVEKRGGRLHVIKGVGRLPVQPAARLPLRAALPICLRCLPHDAPGAGAGRPGRAAGPAACCTLRRRRSQGRAGDRP